MSGSASPPLSGRLVTPRPVATPRPQSLLLLGVALAVVAWITIGDPLAALAVLVLFAIWRFTPPQEGPPVLSLALTFQWIQVCVGVFYCGLTGRELETLTAPAYRLTVLLGLGCVTSLLIGLNVGGRGQVAPRADGGRRLSLQEIGVAYAALVASMGFVQAVAWAIPALTQGILALGYLRLVCLYLLLQRLTVPRPRWNRIVPLLAFEIAVGITGFFAGFREPLILFTLVLLTRFDPKRVRHWLLGGALAGVLLGLGLLWMSIRTPYRTQFQSESFAASRSARAGSILDLSRGVLRGDSLGLLDNLDFFVDRLWVVYYPALAVARVPDAMPHEGGRLFWAAVRHIFTPRLLFPDKPNLPSESDLVRRYSGVWVAGEDEGTSIAFGYAAESYVDFGVPLMFAPMLAWGFVLGKLYRFLLRLIRDRDLATGLVTVMFWLSLYLFERSWAKTLGLTFTIAIYMGAAVYAFDRLFLTARGRRPLPFRAA